MIKNFTFHLILIVYYSYYMDVDCLVRTSSKCLGENTQIILIYAKNVVFGSDSPL